MGGKQDNRSKMISHKHKTVFVHIPKVAGQSVEQMYLADLGLNWSERAVLLLRPKLNTEKGPERLAHLTAAQYTQFGYLSQDNFQNYFKWALVRDPYQRALSCYHFLGYARVLSFENFVQNVLPEKIKQQHFFFLPQYDYLHDNQGQLLVDYVGHLERLDQELVYPKEKTGIQGVSMPHANKAAGSWKRVVRIWGEQPSLIKYFALGHDRKSRKEVLTPRAKAGLNQLYAKDFEAFGYTQQE